MIPRNYDCVSCDEHSIADIESTMPIQDHVRHDSTIFAEGHVTSIGNHDAPPMENSARTDSHGLVARRDNLSLRTYMRLATKLQAWRP